MLLMVLSPQLALKLAHRDERCVKKKFLSKCPRTAPLLPFRPGGFGNPFGSSLIKMHRLEAPRIGHLAEEGQNVLC